MSIFDRNIVERLTLLASIPLLSIDELIALQRQVEQAIEEFYNNPPGDDSESGDLS